MLAVVGDVIDCLSQHSIFAGWTWWACKSRARKRGAVGGGKSMFSMLTYRTLFYFWL